MVRECPFFFFRTRIRQSRLALLPAGWVQGFGLIITAGDIHAPKDNSEASRHGRDSFLAAGGASPSIAVNSRGSLKRSG